MDYLKISADDHIDLGYLPRDLWTSRVPEALRERAPHVVANGDGDEFWVCDGATWGDFRNERWFAKPRNNPLALDRGGVAEAMRPTTPSKRLEDMDRDGVEASVMFPAIIKFEADDPALRDAIVRAYNDWAAEFGAAAPGRFFPVALLSPADPVAATDELLRISKDGRLRQVSFLVNDVTFDMYQEPWDRFWDAADETGTIVSYHVGGYDRPGLRTIARDLPGGARKPLFDLGLGEGGAVWHMPLVSLFSCGILLRRPGLRIVLAESGTGWIPAVVQEMDYRLGQAHERGEAMGIDRAPSELFREQVWATYQTDAVGLHLVDFFGEGHMMWASDYPHHDSTWPFSQEVVDRETAHLPPEITRGIVRDNAAALYGIGG